MYAQVEKRKEKKSRAVANSVAQKKSNVRQGFGFVDNGTEKTIQKLQDNIDTSVIQAFGWESLGGLNPRRYLPIALGGYTQEQMEENYVKPIPEPRAQEPRAQEPRVQGPRAKEPKVKEPKAQEPKAQELMGGNGNAAVEEPKPQQQIVPPTYEKLQEMHEKDEKEFRKKYKSSDTKALRSQEITLTKKERRIVKARTIKNSDALSGHGREPHGTYRSGSSQATLDRDRQRSHKKAIEIALEEALERKKKGLEV